MKKDIYIIKNKINTKCYIGQSKDVTQRFQSHCKPTSAKDNSLIDKAIAKYGRENFYYELLESQVENYNEREKYWIKKLNTLKPNGYNIQEGGEEPPHYYGIDSPNSKFNSEQELQNLKDDLKNTNYSLSTIAKKYGVSKKTVLRINQGVNHHCNSETYPLRVTPNPTGKLTRNQIIEIIDILKNTYMNYEEICKIYQISVSEVKGINNGTIQPIETEQYPIRKYRNSCNYSLTPELVKEIISDIKFTQLSLHTIGKKYNVNMTVIYGICNGSMKRFRQESENYPLRPY